MSDPTLHRDTEVIQARACAYGLLAHAFQYPDRSLVETLIDSTSWSGWPEVLSRLDPRLEAPLADLRGFCRDRGKLGLDGLIDAFTDLFGHAVRGQCPPYELEYNHGEIIQQASELADLAGFYAAFGLQLADGAEGRPDHVSAECEFMAAICAKQAYAVQEGQAEHLEVTLDTQRTFLKDHLGQWLRGLADRIRQAHARGFYGLVAAFAAEWINSECQRMGVTVGPERIELRSADEVLDTSISCDQSAVGVGNAGEEFVSLGIDPTLGQGA